jgi:DinB family protein
MTVTTTDAELLDNTDPALARPLPVAIHEARADLALLEGELLAIPESALAREWAWIGGGDEEVRYAFYRVLELFERAEIDAARTLGASGRDGGLAAALIAPTDAARWDLHGLLAPLSDAEIDADPGGDEWSIRRTLGHVLNGQRAYGWATAVWQAHAVPRDDPSLAEPPTFPIYVGLPDEEGPEMAGTLGDIRARLDAILDLSAERLAGLPQERLGFGTRWSGFAVSIAFRLGRWSSHIREHTIQVEKTLATLDRAPTEPERLVRLVLAAYGRAEAVVFGQPGADAAAGIVRAALTEARAVVADAGRAARA